MKKLLLLLLLVFTFSCTREDLGITSQEPQNDFVFAGVWIQKSFRAQAWIINQGTGEFSNQGNMFYIPITASNGDSWSIDDATAEYDWTIESINGQNILTVAGGYEGQDEIVIENLGDYCFEEWYSLAIIDEWFIRVDPMCD